MFGQPVYELANSEILKAYAPGLCVADVAAGLHVPDLFVGVLLAQNRERLIWILRF